MRAAGLLLLTFHLDRFSTEALSCFRKAAAADLSRSGSLKDKGDVSVFPANVLLIMCRIIAPDADAKRFLLQHSGLCCNTTVYAATQRFMLQRNGLCYGTTGYAAMQ